MKQYIPTWSVNRLAQVYTAEALKDEEYLKNSTDYVQNEKKFMIRQLEEFPFLQVYPPTVNFILLHWLKESHLLLEFKSFLEGKKILIRLCTSYSSLGETWFRIAVKKHEDNIIFIKYLQEFAYEHNLLG